MKKLYTLVVALALTISAYAQPTITSFAPLTGSIGTLLTITGTNLSALTSFSIGGVPAVVVSNDGTTLVGMVMPGAITGSVSVTTASGTVNSLSKFTVSLTLFPTMQEGSKLVGTSGSSDAFQGLAVDISADGNTAIVGGKGDNNGAGAVWIYTRTGTTWTQQGNKLIGTGVVNESQGMSVALSADGNTAIVGGTDDGDIGAAWIFVRNGGVWTQEGSKLVGTGSSSISAQGESVALSADGNTAIVGGYKDNDGIGACWVYTRSGGVWTQQGNKLVATDAVGTTIYQGKSVALSADGNTAVVGGYRDNLNVGAAWVYTRNGNTWTQQGSKIVGTGGNYAQQGYGIDISADGNTIVVGGWADESYAGAVWMFTRTGNIWTQQGGKLIGSNGSNDAYQGKSVAISADGNTVLVGGNNDNNGIGATWVFTSTGSSWAQQGNKIIGTGAIGNAHQGESIALSADANTAIFGGYYDNLGAGAAWIYISLQSITTNVISNNITSNVTVCPNPSNGLYILNVDANIDAINYEITSVDGKTISCKKNVTDKTFSFDLNSERAGIYFLKIENNSFVKNIKLIKL